MTRSELHRLLDAIGPVIKDFVTTKIAAALEPVVAENKALAERVKELEARQMKYMGVFKDGQRYERGELVTVSGSLWHTNEPTILRPPGGPWVLVAKRGADGKDART